MSDRLPEQSLFCGIAKDVRQMLRSDHCEVWRLNRLEGRFQILAMDGDEEVDEGYLDRMSIDMNTHPVINRFLSNLQPILLRNVLSQQAQGLYYHQDEAKARAWTSLYSVPLIRHGRVIGFINSYTHDEITSQGPEYEKSARTTLLNYADRAAEAIRNVELSNQLQALHEVNQILAGTFNEENAIRQILSKGLHLVGAEIGWLYLKDVKEAKLVFKDGQGIPEELVERERALGEGITGYVAQTGTALIVSNVAKSSQYKATDSLEVRSEVAVPLRRSQDTIGTLVAKSRFPNAFAEDDLYVLSMLATQAAIAIQRAKLTRHLQEVSRLALTKDIKELADYLVEAVRDFTGSEVNLWMISGVATERGQCLRIVAGSGDFDGNYIKNEIIPLTDLTRGPAITTMALKIGRPVVRRDILNDNNEPKFYNIEEARRRGWHSFMAVPLIGREGERLGSLSLYSKEEGIFGEPEIEVMRTFANQAAIVIQQQKRSLALQHLVEIGEVLTQSIVGEPRQLLQEAVGMACKLIQADCAVIYPFDPIKEQFYEWEDIASFNLRLPEEVKYRPRVGGLSALIRQVGEMVVHNSDEGDITIDLDRMNQPGMSKDQIVRMVREADFIQRERVRAFVGLSLRASVGSQKIEPQEVGVLYIDFRTPHQFTPDELQIVRIYGHQVANIIHSARLYRKAHRQASELEAVHETALRIVKEEDVDSLLNAIVEEAARLLKATGGKLYLQVPGEDKVRLVAVKGIDPKLLKPGDTLPFGEGMVGRVIQSRKPLIVNDYRRWPGQIKRLAAVLTAVMEVPLMLGENTIGVLAVIDDTKKRRFTENDIPVLERLAQQASLAIHNARILERERHLREQAETLREISSAIISSELELKEVAGRILDELGKVVEYHKASIQLFRGGARELLAYRGFNTKHFDPWLLRPISEDRLVGQILADKKPRVLSKTSDSPYWETRPSTANVQSWLGVPLVYRDGVIGLLTLDHNVPGFYTQAIEGLLVQFANHAAIAVANARLFSDAQRRIRDLEIVNSIVRTINTKLDTKDLLQTIVSQIAEELNCSHCTIFLMHKNGDDYFLVPEVTHGRRSKNILTRRFGPGEGLAGLVFREGKTLIVDDVTGQPQFAPARDARGKPRSMLVVPVKVGDRTIGVISADQDARGWFSENDGRLVDALAGHAGIAIERAMGLRLLQEVGTRIIAFDEEESILQRIVAGAIELSHTNAGIIHLISDDRQSIIKSYPHPTDFAPAEPRMRTKEGVTRQVVDSGKMIIISDTYLDDRVRLDLRDHARALIVTPLMIDQRVVGVLSLYDRETHFFTETESSFLATLASQAAVTIKNADLFRELRRRNKELEALNKIGQAVSTLDIDHISKVVYQQTSSLMDTSSFFLCVYDDCENRLDFKVWVHNGRRFRPAPRELSGLTGLVIREKRPLLIRDWDEEEKGFAVEADIVTERRRSWLGVPMLIGGKAIGVISVQSPAPQAFDSGTESLLETVASQAAIAIENARLIQRIQQQRAGQVEAMRDISGAIAAPLRLRDVLKGILRWAITLVGRANLGEIRLLDKKTDDLVVRAWQGKKIKREYRRIPIGKGITGWVAEQKKSLLVADVEKNPNYLAILDGTGSELAVPMLNKKGQLIGVLNIEHPKVGAFTDDDLILAEAIAGLAVVAIENAELFRAWQEAQERATAVQRLTIMSEVGALLAHRLNNLAGPIPVRVSMAKENLRVDDPRDAQVIRELDAIDDLAEPLLEAARIIRPSPEGEIREEVDVAELLEVARKRVWASQPDIEGRIKANSTIARGIPKLRVDKTGFLDSLTNIIRNAVEAIPGDGAITFSARTWSLRGKPCFEVRISDTGEGIPNENLTKIFDLFFTTKANGFGFGLWMSKTFIKRVGGDLEVRSRRAKGTTLLIKIPIQAEEP
jgi:GAF domain-containing protein